MEQHCALCGKYIHRTEDPIRGKDGRIYHAYCYSRVKDKLEKEYEKKGIVSRVKRSFRQPEAYLSEQKQEKLYAITGGPEYGWHIVTLGTDGKWYNFFGKKPMNRSALDKAIENVTKMGFSKIDDWDPRHPELLGEARKVYNMLLKEEKAIFLFVNPDPYYFNTNGYYSLRDWLDSNAGELGFDFDTEHLGVIWPNGASLEELKAQLDKEGIEYEEFEADLDRYFKESKPTIKREQMKIKLSELKRLIREESLLLEGISGKSFCITGTLSRPRTEAWTAIEEAGGIVHRSVKRGTDFLVTGAAIGRSKIANAERLGVTVIDEKELWHMIRGGRRPNENPKTWRGTSGRGHGELRVDRRFEREPSYLDLAGLTSESRELMKEIEDIEREIKNSEYGKYLKSVESVDERDYIDDAADYKKVTLTVPTEDIDDMYGSSKQAENVLLFDRDFRTEFEVYNSEPGSFNRSVSLENKSIVGQSFVFEYIFRDFYNV